MKHPLLYSGLALAGLLLAGLGIVQLTQISDIPGAIALLGKSEGAFQEARTRLLLSSADAVGPLIKVARNRSKSERVRIEALTILKALGNHSPLDSLSELLLPILKEPSQKLRMSALGTIATFGVTNGSPALLQIIATDLDTGMVNGALQAFGRGAATLDIRIQRAIASGDSLLIRTVLAALDSVPGGNGDAFLRASAYFREQGDLERATDLYKRAGYIRRWWTLGTFPNIAMAAFLRTLEPDTAPFDFKQSFKADDTTSVSWTPLGRASDWLDLNSLYLRNANVVNYLSAFILVPSDRKALLFTGIDDCLRIFVNDSLVFTSPELYGSIMEHNAQTRIFLHKGVNRLLMKTGQELGNWTFYARLTGIDGRPMNDATVSLSPEPPKNPSAPLLAACGGDLEPCRKMVDSIDIADDAVVNDLVTIADDDALPAGRRITALKALIAVNASRATHADRDLVRTATTLYDHGQRGGLLDTMVLTIAYMSTIEGFDLGARLRADTSAQVKLLGNILLSSYCNARLNRLPAGTDAAQQTVADLEKLDPVHIQVIERMVRALGAASSDPRVQKLRGRFAMPSKWLVRTDIKIDWKTLGKTDVFGKPLSFDSVWQAAAKTKAGSWQRFEVAPNSPFAPAMAAVDPKSLAGTPDRFGELFTEVYSDRDDSLMLDIFHSGAVVGLIRVNGKLISFRPIEHRTPPLLGKTPRYTSLDDVPEFMMPVKLVAGKNTISIGFANFWFLTGDLQTFRCGFAELSGTPIACTNNRINLAKE